MQKQTHFIVSHNDENFGPFTRDEIEGRLKSGEFSLVDFAYDEEKSDWVTLLEFLPDMATAVNISISHFQEEAHAEPPRVERAPEIKDEVSEPVMPHADADEPPSKVASFFDEKTSTAISIPAVAAQPPAHESAQESPSMKSASASDNQTQSQIQNQTQNQTQNHGKNQSKSKTVAEQKPEDGSENVSTNSTKLVAQQQSESAALKTNASKTEKIAATHGASNGAAHGAAHEMKLQSDQLELRAGVGTLDLLHTSAGEVRLSFNIENGKNLELPNPLPLVVRAAQAQKIVIQNAVGLESVVGESCDFELLAVDKFGNHDTSFTGSIMAEVNGSAEGAGKVSFAGGRATVSITNKTAEKVSVRFKDSDNLGLDVSINHSITFMAGPAARLEVVAPTEVVAGETAKLMVKAFDIYGNLATDYGGIINVEIKSAGSTIKASVA